MSSGHHPRQYIPRYVTVLIHWRRQWRRRAPPTYTCRQITVSYCPGASAIFVSAPRSTCSTILQFSLGKHATFKTSTANMFPSIIQADISFRFPLLQTSRLFFQKRLPDAFFGKVPFTCFVEASVLCPFPFRLISYLCSSHFPCIFPCRYILRALEYFSLTRQDQRSSLKRMNCNKWGFVGGEVQ